MPDTTIGWAISIVAFVATYELVRHLIIRRIRGRMRKGALRFVRRHRVQLESARFIDRVWLRESLLMDDEVDQVVVEAAQSNGLPLREIRQRVAEYVDEIAPAFSITAYYRIGRVVAGGIVKFAYEVIFDHHRFRHQMARVPKDARVVFIMNHRSNMDYLVLSFVLLKHVALSYAVGEWAQVWPLNKLFKAFGSYFVRRGEKDPVYHKVLERFIQILVGHGGVTGFFLEGRFSRDGKMGHPKSGLVDYIVGIQRANPDTEIAFIPVGLNFDRTPEDKHLVAERDGPVPAPTLTDRLHTIGHLLHRVPTIIGANFARVATKSHRKFGYAAVAIGPPVLVSAHGFGGPNGKARLSPDERRPEVQALAAHLKTCIEAVIPATPVAVFCLAWCRCQVDGQVDGQVRAGDLKRGVRQVLAQLREAKAPVALGRAFPAPMSAPSAIPGLGDEVEAVGEAEILVTLAGHALGRRGLVQHSEQVFRVNTQDRPLIEYYANSIAHHVDKASDSGSGVLGAPKPSPEPPSSPAEE